MVTPAASVRSSKSAIESAGRGQAAQKRAPIAHPFFLAERDHVDAERQPAPAQGLHGRRCRAARRARRRICRHWAPCRGASRSRAQAPPVAARRNGRSSCPRHRAEPQAGLFHPLGSIRSCRPRIGSLRKVRVIPSGSSEETRPRRTARALRPPKCRGRRTPPVAHSSQRRLEKGTRIFIFASSPGNGGPDTRDNCRFVPS